MSYYFAIPVEERLTRVRIVWFVIGLFIGSFGTLLLGGVGYG